LGKIFTVNQDLEKLPTRKKHECFVNKKKLIWPESPVALIIHISAG
jgi:hypothetical protein